MSFFLVVGSPAIHIVLQVKSSTAIRRVFHPSWCQDLMERRNRKLQEARNQRGTRQAQRWLHGNWANTTDIVVFWHLHPGVHGYKHVCLVNFVTLCTFLQWQQRNTYILILFIAYISPTSSNALWVATDCKFVGLLVTQGWWVPCHCLGTGSHYHYSLHLFIKYVLWTSTNIHEWIITLHYSWIFMEHEALDWALSTERSEPLVN